MKLCGMSLRHVDCRFSHSLTVALTLPALPFAKMSCQSNCTQECNCIRESSPTYDTSSLNEMPGRWGPCGPALVISSTKSSTQHVSNCRLLTDQLNY